MVASSRALSCLISSTMSVRTAVMENSLFFVWRRMNPHPAFCDGLTSYPHSTRTATTKRATRSFFIGRAWFAACVLASAPSHRRRLLTNNLLHGANQVVGAVGLRQESTSPTGQQ